MTRKKSAVQLQREIDEALAKPPGRTVIAYHGSSVPIQRFDPKFWAPEGGFWFSEDKDKILRGESGAVGTAYLMKVRLHVNKVAGWDEYDRYLIDQLLGMDYDSIKLDDDWVVFDPKRIEVLKVNKIERKRRSRVKPRTTL
jgi:hypothetical protein